MDTKLQSSFIPKRPVVMTQSGRAARLSSPVGFFGFVILLVVAAAVLGSAGVFFYQTYLVSAKEGLNGQLSAAREAIDQGIIDELMRVGKRLSVANDLLGNHVSVSSFFTFLEANTVQRVQFTDFRYSLDSRRGTLVVDMSGRAPDYTTLVFQSDTFLKHANVKGVSFTDLNLDTNGDVLFFARLTLNPTDFLFKDSFASISLSFPY